MDGREEPVHTREPTPTSKNTDKIIQRTFQRKSNNSFGEQ